MQMSEPLYAAPDDVLLRACSIEHMRSSGPGGQHAQKNASAVRLHEPTHRITVQCQDFRSAADNQKRALKQLRIQLALCERGQSRSEWLDQQRHGTRIQCGPDASSYPKVVGCLLDALAQHDYDLKSSAVVLQCSSSQIIKVLRAHKAVWQFLQDQRAAHGLPPLKA